MPLLPAAEPWWAKYATQLIVAGFGAQLLTNVRSVVEHWLNRKKEREHAKEIKTKLDVTVSKLDAIHEQLNGNGRDHTTAIR